MSMTNLQNTINLKIKNELKRSSAYFCIDDREDETSLWPETEKDSEFASGVELSIYFKRSDGRKHYLLFKETLFNSGVYRIYSATHRAEGPPKLSFEPCHTEKKYNEQQYIEVGQAIREISETKAGLVTKQQLDDIIEDMF
ncbi:uncharacterized protein ACA1_177410 [Acanthamoeba castellanii str. Neff]|uniref:Uncharacterized protein n=1 Tax=Acanthamoeba castellanii (strain ATCC 30010 / Neff) TaxID=1257118 RepID=L8GU46_ACACF|nr:uncharacterized protein ACA1_177410 [Acanthamoeba castellanii str. Neff]ELR16133.1 hypothetical protein ACA1_177410 [Acanthamoeba castellanii str. Neff]